MAFDNTVSAELNLAKVLDIMLEEFVAEILPISAFSLGIARDKSGNIQTLNQLGTDTVRVPYVPAVSAASKDFDAAAGDCYETDTTSLSFRQVVVDVRKYQSWGVTSEQSAKTPILGKIDFFKTKARKLAADVVANILSVVDDTNFPNESVVGAANAFDTDVMFDVRDDANGFKIPKMNRSAILKDDYFTSLMKDNKDANLYGNSQVRWDAQLPRIAGMNTFETLEGLDGADDIDAGIVTYPSGILVAGAPLEPTDGIKKKLLDFQIVTHEESGLSLVYKHMADETCDSEMEVVEWTGGKDVGEADALLRLVAA